MKYKNAVFVLVLFITFTGGNNFAADDDPGEFYIPEVYPLNRRQVKKLRSLVKDKSSARPVATEIKKKGEKRLDGKPDPIDVIHYEGLVNTNPKRIESVKHLEDMVDVAWLVRYWQAYDDSRAAGTLKKYIIEWTNAYELTGNDVNENKFFPLLVAYYSLRHEFSGDQRKNVDRWVYNLGKMHRKSVKNSRHFTNRYGKHLRLLAITGMILNRRTWIDEVKNGIRKFVRHGLFPDGTSRDLKRRDSLTYHKSALGAVVGLALILGEEGRELYTWQSPKGASIKKSVDFTVPYALGEKKHREWVDSKVGLDKKRAKAGLEKYKPGKIYDPQDLLELMELASYFDSDLLDVVRHLTDKSGRRFFSWQIIVNKAARQSGR